MPNCEELKRTLKHIKSLVESPNPVIRNLWDQGDWCTETECGTAYCFAGWTVVLNGYDINVDAMSVLGNIPKSLLVNSRYHFVNHVATVAQNMLDLSSSEAHTLFNGDNTLEDLENIVNKLCCDDCKD